ncbi:hypothetical protein BKA83DRAFT_4230137 [Pisolithus microcarpus]|nr:hypothetical protein BKA83DRAFT_4230137 [Pisolithus microcarpus]
MSLSTTAFCVAFSCETLLYGANAVLFLTSLVILRKKRNQNNITHPITILNGLIFLCCTAHFALEFNSFVVIIGTASVNPVLRLMGAYILASVTDFLSGIFLIYRCWMIWTRIPVVIVFPFVVALGGFACTASAARLEFTDAIDAASALNIAGYTLSACANIIVTSLIIYRIQRTPHKLLGFSESNRRRATHSAVGFLIESGVLYFPTQLAYVILFAVKSYGSFIAGAVVVQVYGIATALIVIRVALGISLEHTHNTVIPTGHRVACTWHPDGLEAVTDMGSGGAMKEPMFTSDYSETTYKAIHQPLKHRPRLSSNAQQPYYGPRYPSHPSGKPIPEIA